MDRREQEALIKTALKHMKAYDAAPREFEHVGLTFELTISATCFAQLKRHRMATITVQEYDPALGVMVPPTVTAIGDGKDVPGDLRPDGGDLGEDPPGRARCSRLHPDERPPAARRGDAQRPRALPSRPRPGGPQRPVGHPGNRGQMVAAGREVMPLTLILAAGKDGFDALRTEVFADER